MLPGMLRRDTSRRFIIISIIIIKVRYGTISLYLCSQRKLPVCPTAVVLTVALVLPGAAESENLRFILLRLRLYSVSARQCIV